MNALSIILIILISIGFLLALKAVFIDKKTKCGGCNSDCSGCMKNKP